MILCEFEPRDKILCLSCAPAFTCLSTAIYLLVEHIVCQILIVSYIFSGVDLAYVYSSCSLAGRLSYSTFHNLALL
jgi:hypothetical protein